MKIGIMTFWWSDDNYGQLLQCYALQKYLRDLGHEAYLIRYRHDNDIIRTTTPFGKKIWKAFNPKQLYNFAKNRINRKKLEIERKNNDRQFELFRQKYIVQSPVLYTSLKELQDNPPEADVYIVGSDQVWNNTPLSMFKKRIPAYFLDFGTNTVKRISYAASWGRSKISEEEIAIIKPFLANFDFVSVREKSGIEICKNCGCEKAQWVPDPTMLLTADKYREIYKGNDIHITNKKFLLLYMLGNEFDFDINNVYIFAAKKKLEVIYVTGNSVLDRNRKFFATIPEWLYLVDNAEYVITNSFHCGVFSTIFHKRFGIIALTGKCIGMNARIDSLFEMCGIGQRYISAQDFEVLDKEYEVRKVNIPVFLR